MHITRWSLSVPSGSPQQRSAAEAELTAKEAALADLEETVADLEPRTRRAAARAGRDRQSSPSTTVPRVCRPVLLIFTLRFTLITSNLSVPGGQPLGHWDTPSPAFRPDCSPGPDGGGGRQPEGEADRQ